MCTKFQFDMMKISETTAIETFALLVGPPCISINHPLLRDAHGAVLKGLPVRENRAQESGSEITVERRRLVYVDRAKQKTSY